MLPRKEVNVLKIKLALALQGIQGRGEEPGMSVVRIVLGKMLLGAASRRLSDGAREVALH
jgi:hypothetical protein